MGNEELHVVYTSRLAADRDYAVFAPICRSARSRNAELGVAGVLLFDGQRFLQWLHGPAETVSALMRVIAADPRHEDLVIHLEAALPASPSQRRWRSGFIDAEMLDEFARSGPGSDRLLDQVFRLIAAADLEPADEPDGERVPGSGTAGAGRPAPAV